MMRAIRWSCWRRPCWGRLAALGGLRGRRRSRPLPPPNVLDVRSRRAGADGHRTVAAGEHNVVGAALGYLGMVGP